MNTPSKTIEHLIIGGGPAGSMAAIRLAQAGLPVTLIERERCPHHKVCGEFLSQEAVDYLHQVGLSPHNLGAVGLRFLRLSSGRSTTETALPFPALSLSRRILDEALIKRAADYGCNVLRGHSARNLTADGDAWNITLANGEHLRARTAFLATGKHDLHGCERGTGAQNDLIGFKLHWRLAPEQTDELHDSMELFLFRDGYGGLSLVESQIANLCLVVRRSRLRSMQGWNSFFAALLDANPRLRHYLANARAEWLRPLAISPIPYGYLASTQHGPWRIGDQAAVIPSFTGDGVSIALHSAALAAQMFLDRKTPQEYSSTLHAQLQSGMTLATSLSRIMVTGPGRHLGVTALSLIPQAMQWIAASTRVPAQSLLPASK